MKSKFTKIIISILAIFGIFGLAVTPVFAAEDCSDICNPSCTSVPNEVKSANGCPNYATSDELKPAITKIINAIIGVLGIIAVIVIIIGGIQYMTSTGDPGKTKKAKDTILYATIGLIICVLSFAIVNFVILNILGDNPSNYTTSTACENNGHDWDYINNKCK